jgi:hypothetical protein
LREETRDVEKAALPAGVGRLLFAGQAGDIEPVGGDVVRRRAKRHDDEEG